MATFRAVNNAKVTSGPGASAISDGIGGGKPATFFDLFITPAGMADGDSVEFGPRNALRKGDTFLGFELWNGAIGAGISGSLGDDGDAARYMAAVSVAAAGATPKRDGTIGGFGYLLTQDRPMLLKLTGGAAAAGQVLKLSWRVLRA